jgi:hypothetical protein
MPTNTYTGTHEGQHYSSLYPNLYRVQFRARIGWREYDVDRVVPAIDAAHARQRAASGGMTVYGAIDVEHVGTLDKEE